MTLPMCLVCPLCRAPFTSDATGICCSNGHHYASTGGVVDLLGHPAPTTPAAVVNEWALTAWAYERLWRPFALSILSGERFPIARETAILCAALTHAPTTVLDVGCANGLYARTLAHAFPHAEIVAVDRAAPMLRVAARHPDAANHSITWLRADAAALPIADHSVDTIVSGGTFNECESLSDVLTAIGRVATATAQVFSMHLINPTSRTRQTSAPSGVRLFSADEIPARLAAHGWQITTTHTTGRVQFVTAVRQGSTAH